MGEVIEILLNTVADINMKLENYPDDMMVSDSKFGSYMELLSLRKDIFEKLVSVVYPMGCKDHTKIIGFTSMLIEVNTENKDQIFGAIKNMNNG